MQGNFTPTFPLNRTRKSPFVWLFLMFLTALKAGGQCSGNAGKTGGNRFSGASWHRPRLDLHPLAALYRKARKNSKYIRQTGFAPIQQEQMVPSYMDKQGSIKRADAMDLLFLTTLKARLVDVADYFDGSVGSLVLF